MFRDPRIVLGLMAVWTLLLIAWALFERYGRRLQFPRISAGGRHTLSEHKFSGVAWPQGAFLPWDRATPVAEKRPLSAPQKSLAGVMRPFST